MKLILFFFLFLLSLPVKSQTNFLDTNFGTAGKVSTTWAEDISDCYGSALQEDGKILTVGVGNNYSVDPPIDGFLIVRYLNNGSLDENFGDNGRVITSFKDIKGDGTAQAVAVQEDDKFVVVGYGGTVNSSSYNDIFMVRYKADGTVDSSFGENGIVVSDIGGNENGNCLAIQRDGKIVVGGNSSANFLAVRYLPDGSLDNSFGNGGKVSTPYSGLAAVMSIAIDNTGGKIIAAGFANQKCAVARYLDNGKFDPDFGGGIIANGFGFSYALYRSVLVQEDGTVIAAGEVGQGYDDNMIVAKYDIKGNLDAGFGNKGSVFIKFGDAYSRASSVGIQKDKKIVAIGSTYDVFYNKKDTFAVARLMTNGALDTSFGIEGKATADFGDAGENSSSGFIDTEDRIIVQGFSNINTGILLARFLSGEKNKKQIIITKIRRWIQHHNGFTWDANSNISSYIIQRSYNGIHFNSIARINAGNTSNYTYADASPLSGNNYYRLQTTSADGEVNYSNVIAVANNDIKILPNPAKSSLHIEGLSSNQKIKLTVVDFSGNEKLHVIANNPSYNLNISSLKAGSYLLKIETNDDVITKKFVKE